jgi:choice-of-anchor C domain-containing protein
MPRQILLAVGLLLLLPVARAEATPFMNGSFELNSDDPTFGSFDTLAPGSTVITGWQILLNSIDYINGYWEAADGTHSVDLNGNTGAAAISQTFDTTLGTSYLVQFALAGNPDNLPTIKTVRVDSGAFTQDYTFDVTGATRPDMNWEYKDFLFIAGGTSSTLTFLSQTEGCCWGPALDDVSVEAVPEPALMTLFGTGLVTLLVRRRSRNTPAS